MPYTWVTDPPVQLLQPENFVYQVGVFRETLRRFAPGLTADRTVAAIEKILDAMGDIAHEEECRLHAYMVDGCPVGLLIMSGGMMKKIEEMVGHPAAEGAGSILTEFAVNTSGTGDVSLDSLNTESTAFWTAMGFVRTGELHVHGEVGSCKMRLKASTSDKWLSIGGKWRLQKYISTPGYMATVD